MSVVTPPEQRLAAALAPRVDAQLCEQIDTLYNTIGHLTVGVRQRDRVIARLRRELNTAYDRPGIEMHPLVVSDDDDDTDEWMGSLHSLTPSPLPHA